MSAPNPNSPIVELRIALTSRDYERSVKFYCDGLGIKPEQIWNNGEGRGLIINMGQATLEIFDEAQAQTIDQIEAGQRISGQIRFALQVPDLTHAMERLITHGATLVHEPIIAPGVITTCGSRTRMECKSLYFKNRIRLNKAGNFGQGPAQALN